MNSLNVIGRVGGEVELRSTSSGKSVAQLTLAVDDGWGENKKTVWLSVTLWGATADLAAKAVQKGDRLGISGRLTQDEWTDKDGKKQTKTRVTAESMHLLQPKREAATAPSYPARAMQGGAPPPPAQEQDEDDIPF